MSQFNFGLNIYNPAQMYFGLNFQATTQQSAYPQQNLTGLGDPFSAFMSAMQVIDSGQIYQNPYGLNFSNNQNQMNAQQQQQLKMMEFFYQLLMMLLEMIMKIYQDFQNYQNNVNNNYTPPGYASGKGATDEAGGANNAGGANEAAATQNANETEDANQTGQPDSHLPVDAVEYEPSGESTPMGEAIARRAIEEVNNRAEWQNMNEYWCGAGVGNVLNDLGLEMGRADGSNWDELLQDNPNFVEVSVDRENLDELPPGAVVVWEEKDGISGDNDGDFGHVSIALGDGREASDRYRNQLNMQGRDYHVFLPKDYVEQYPEKFSSNNNNPPSYNTTQTSNNTANNTSSNNTTQTQTQTQTETSRPEPRRTERNKPQAA